MGKDDRLHFRLDPASRKKLQQACALTGLDEPTALRACIQAFIEHIEENGGIWLPLSIVPKTGPPGKMSAGTGQQAAGQTVVEAARGGSRSTASLPASLNEAAPQEIKPVLPARAKAGPHPRSTGGIKRITKPPAGK